MKLIIGNQPVALYPDSELSMERLSPALNDKVGSFSYPFSVPTQPNQKALGWPGKLERTGDIPSKSFIVEDQGMQVLRGEVEYDTITREDIGIILTSGLTEFYTLLETLKDDGSTLADLDWGSESWFSDQPTTYEIFQAKLGEWDQKNRLENAPFVVSPFQYSTPAGTIVVANKHDAEGYLIQEYAELTTPFMYMLQFRAWWMLERIFEILGYTVILDELNESEWKKLVVLTRPFLVTLMEADPELYQNQILVHPPKDTLEYAFLMPKISTYDFMDEIRVLMGLAFDIDDLKKEVKIIQLKSIIEPGESVTELTEMSGWQHKEGKSAAEDGYSISFMTQDDPLDNRDDYTPDITVATISLRPAPTVEGYICRVTSVGADYIVKKWTGTNNWIWSPIGRIRTVTSGLGKTKIECNVKVASGSLPEANLFKGPVVKLAFTGSEYGMTLYDMSDIYISLYRGLATNFVITDYPFQTVPIPFLSSDKWLSDTLVLSPQGILNSVYLEYLVWKTSNTRSFTKYVRLTLPELLALEWNRRYVISGVKVLLSKINYDLPFSGIVKIEGYVS